MATKITQNAERRTQNLKNKRILITAGSTWVSIDGVRVISNIATGQTGILLAKEAVKYGAEVTLLLGPVGATSLDKSIKIIRYKFFAELKEKIIKELRSKRYDLVIHSAAVSDFKPTRQIKGKLNSDRIHNLELVPLPKIIQDIRRLLSPARLVMFKLDSGISDRTLIQRAKSTKALVGTKVIVANRINPYRAFIIGEKNNVLSVRTKEELAKNLFKIIYQTPKTW